MLCYFMHLNTLCNNFLHNEVILRLFNSDTAEDDFSGFSAQEEDEESDRWRSWWFNGLNGLTSRVTGTVQKKTSI